jgi:predicted adenylyl cyclase CyaB
MKTQNMSHILNIEIKAQCSNLPQIRSILKKEKAKYIGLDFQIDTYFNCNNGRIKLRAGNIENALIFYKRANTKTIKESQIILEKLNLNNNIKQLLTDAYGVKVEVAKKREIYFIDNIKIHLDEVKELGEFVEIEAIDCTGKIGKEMLQEQCNKYIKMFEIKEAAFVDKSYSDLILEKK